MILFDLLFVDSLLITDEKQVSIILWEGLLSVDSLVITDPKQVDSLFAS